MLNKVLVNIIMDTEKCKSVRYAYLSDSARKGLREQSWFFHDKIVSSNTDDENSLFFNALYVKQVLVVRWRLCSKLSAIPDRTATWVLLFRNKFAMA